MSILLYVCVCVVMDVCWDGVFFSNNITQPNACAAQHCDGMPCVMEFSSTM